jgi:hypothetical protein
LDKEDDDDDDDKDDDDDENSVDDEPEPNQDQTNKCTKITVQECEVAGRDKTGKPFYTKQNFCLFCEYKFSKLPKHLERRHGDKDLIIELKKLPVNSKERKACLDDLTKVGNFHHNLKVWREKQGELVVVRRPSSSKDYVEFLPCTHCLGTFAAIDLWRHNIKCQEPRLEGKNESEIGQNHVLRGSRAFLNCALNNSPKIAKMTELVSKMRRKDLAKIILEDPLIMAFGYWMLTMHGTNINQSGYIIGKCRELARLIQYVKESEKMDELSLTNLIHPSKWDTVVQAVKQMPSLGPSTSKRIGQTLQKVIVVYKGHLMTTGNRKDRKNADDFEWLITSQWQDLVAIPAQRALSTARDKKPDAVPFTNDVKTMSIGLSDALKKDLLELKSGKMSLARRVLEICLARIVTFNKRRLVILIMHTPVMY